MVKFKDFSRPLSIFKCFSSDFQGKFNFEGLFMTFLYIQVLFKSVGTLGHSDIPERFFFIQKN